MEEQNKLFESVSVVNELSSKRIKDSEERYLLGQNTTCEFSRQTPLYRTKN